jgi:unsaturated rhamnogalacturonyl hydrolase
MGAHITALRDAPTRENLRQLSIYIIVDPDTPLETADPHFILPGSADAIVEWVKEGGILVLMGNDSGNAEFAHLNALGERFGIHFNEDSHHRVVGTDFAAGTCDSFPSHPVFKGVRRVYLKEISSLRLRPPATPFLRDGNLVVMATSRAGKGMVFAVGDPWLYNEYFDARKLPPGYDNARAGEHLFRWLLQHAHRHGSPAGSQPKND